MVILADKNQRELCALTTANFYVDVNDKMEFSIQIARSYWTDDLTFCNYVYIPDTEFGGMIGNVITSTTLDYVELKGITFRGRLEKKIISPPVGTSYKTVSGELNNIMKGLIESEFDGLFVVPKKDTGIVINNYTFDRYCTLLDGLTKMLKSVGYKLRITYKRELGTTNYVLIEAVEIIDYSTKIELSKDCRLNYTMDDKRDGINHLIVTGKGELKDRNVLNLYVRNDGSIGTQQYYYGADEIAEVYENTSTETDELWNKSVDKFKELMNRKVFKMNVAKLGLSTEIGDIVGGRDYLTALCMSKPIANIIYELVNNKEAVQYKLEGEE